jgi:membrane-associated protein
MSYPRFLAFNVIGGIMWVSLFVSLGYFFGNLPVVQNNFELAIIAIILLSLVPMIYEFVKSRIEARREKAEANA